MVKTVICIYLCGITTILPLQSQPSYVVYGSAGKILPHTSSLAYEVPPRSFLAQVEYWSENNNRAWRTYWNQPNTGLVLAASDLGKESVLGHTLGLMPAIRWKLWQHRQLAFRIKVSSGLGFHTKEYNAISNPTNNAIGSALNNMTSLGLEAMYGPYLCQIQLTHHSNGGSVTPNRGINLITVGLGYQWGHVAGISEVGQSETEVQNSRKIGFDIAYLHGIHQEGVPGGPTYTIRTISSSICYHASPYVTLLGGVEGEYDQSRYYFLVNDFSDKKVAQREANHISATAAISMQFGPIYIRPRIGYYLGDDITQDPYYVRVEASFTPWLRPLKLGKPYIGVNMKSHKAVAQYVGLHIGLMY